MLRGNGILRMNGLNAESIGDLNDRWSKPGKLNGSRRLSRDLSWACVWAYASWAHRTLVTLAVQLSVHRDARPAVEDPTESDLPCAPTFRSSVKLVRASGLLMPGLS
eukprot:1297163-Rhodomonas_salina.4